MREWSKIEGKRITAGILFVALLFLSSCSRDTDTYPPETDSSNVFQFSASVESYSKTTTYDFSFADGDKIGIFAVKRTDPSKPNPLTQEELANAYAKNRPYTYNATALHWEPADGGVGIPIPHDNTSIDFYAYYPYDATLGTAGNDNFVAIPLTIAEDQSTQEAFDNADLLYGTGTVKIGRKEVHLSFRHLLCYIRLTLTADGVDEKDIRAIYLNKKYTQIKFNLAQGTVGPDEAQTPDKKVNISFHRETSQLDKYIYNAIIVPQPISSEEEDFEILFEFSGIKQGYTSRLAPDVSAVVSGESYHPTVIMQTPPVRIKIDIDQLLAETNNAKPQTWSYTILNEGRKFGEVCREYVRATPYTDEEGNPTSTADAQMIVAYPMAANGKNIDMERGVVLAVLADDAKGDPTGTIDRTVATGGKVRLFYDINGDKRMMYIAGNRTEAINEFYIYRRNITFTPPVEDDNVTPVAPIVRTWLAPDYLTLTGGDKYGIVKIGAEHVTQQYLSCGKYIDHTDILSANTREGWNDKMNTNSPNYDPNYQHNPFYLNDKEVGIYYYNYATVEQIEKIIPSGWTLPQQGSAPFVNYLGGVNEVGKYLRLQAADDTHGYGNNKAGLGLVNAGYINGYGIPQLHSSKMWFAAGSLVQLYSIELSNAFTVGALTRTDGIPIRLIRTSK